MNQGGGRGIAGGREEQKKQLDIPHRSGFYIRFGSYVGTAVGSPISRPKTPPDVSVSDVYLSTYGSSNGITLNLPACLHKVWYGMLDVEVMNGRYMISV